MDTRQTLTEPTPSLPAFPVTPVRAGATRAKLDAILRETPTETADAIATVANECAHELRAQGWQGDGAAYNLGAYPGDEELLAGVLDRATTPEERVAFERCVRACLGAT